VLVLDLVDLGWRGQIDEDNTGKQRADSPVSVRLRHGERIGRMPDLAHAAVIQQHLHDIEADLHRRRRGASSSVVAQTSESAVSRIS